MTSEICLPIMSASAPSFTQGSNQSEVFWPSPIALIIFCLALSLCYPRVNFQVPDCNKCVSAFQKFLPFRYWDLIQDARMDFDVQHLHANLTPAAALMSFSLLSPIPPSDFGTHIFSHAQTCILSLHRNLLNKLSNVD